MKEETLELTIDQALDHGVAMAMAGKHENAAGLFQGVLMHEPQNFEAIERLGASLFELKRYHEALYWFWRGRKINHRHPLALTNYGLTVAQLGHWEEGLADLERAVYWAERSKTISLEAKALTYNNLGNTLEKLKRYPEALHALDAAIALNPNDHFPHYNRGIVLLRLNRQREAIAALDTALEIRPNDPDALYNRSMGQLLLGDLGGFADYEARLLTSENKVINLGLPADMKWQGEDLAGKRILVHAEQGLGDDIQFMRFLPLLAQKHPQAHILLIVHNAMKPLTAGLPVTVLPAGGDLHGAFDYWVPLMSLPLRLGIEREEDIPSARIVGDRIREAALDRMNEWRDRLPRDGRLNVGVVWAGNWLHKNDAHRSIELATFARLFEAEGCNFVSLQQMQPIDTDTFKAIATERDNVSALWLEDWRNTAAVIENLDMVISVDTAVAHLAASLGKPTFILIPAFGTDWRWQLQRTDSPWYPSAALVRQHTVGDWVSVIDRLRRDLSEVATEKDTQAA